MARTFWEEFSKKLCSYSIGRTPVALLLLNSAYIRYCGDWRDVPSWNVILEMLSSHRVYYRFVKLDDFIGDCILNVRRVTDSRKSVGNKADIA